MAGNRRVVLSGITATFALLSPALADRASLIPVIFRACQNQLLGNAQFVSLLALNGITVEAVCQCQGPLFISRLSDTDVVELPRQGFNQPAWDRLFEASRLCALNMTVRRSR